MYFCNFVIISPRKIIGPSFEQTQNPLHPRILCAKFRWNWSTGLEKKILKFVNLFSQFCNYLPLEKGRALHLNKLVSPSCKDDLCQVWFFFLFFLFFSFEPYECIYYIVTWKKWIQMFFHLSPPFHSHFNTSIVHVI